MPAQSFSSRNSNEAKFYGPKSRQKPCGPRSKAIKQGPLHAGALQTSLREGPTTRQRPQNQRPFYSPVFSSSSSPLFLPPRENSWAVRRARATLIPVSRARCPRAFLFFLPFPMDAHSERARGGKEGREECTVALPLV